MRSLFWKGMLAFMAVILVAVGTVAVLAGLSAENELLRYAYSQSGVWNRHLINLASYYTIQESWNGLQDSLPSIAETAGRGRGSGGGGASAPQLGFRVSDLEGRIVGDTDGEVGGTVQDEEMNGGIPIEVAGQIVGYLLPTSDQFRTLPLDQSQTEFLTRMRATLWIGAAAAMVAALAIGGLLFRSIIAPLRHLTSASQTIAAGDLSARAPVRGEDEVAQLATSFNRMAESLGQAEEARRNQTADIAHELRTPISVIQGSLEAMLDGVYAADRENLTAALRHAHSLSRLVEDLRLLALADTGRLRLQEAPLDVEPFLRETVGAYQLQARERAISVALEASRVQPVALVDRDRLSQVMGNLLDNALRYVPEAGHITVRVHDQGREVVISVVDNGPGVDEKDLPLLFERFWRGDSSRNRFSGGSGLGLAIARHIVEAHGGRMWAEPTPGGGLTVSFTLSTAELS